MGRIEGGAVSVTSGAGFNLAGIDMGAGRDLLTFTVPAALPPLPSAIFYSATSRSFTQNADGTFMPVHPVDQQVQTLLSIPQGKVPALGKVGARYLARFQGLPPQMLQSVALDETQVALRDLIAANDIKLVSVTVDTSVPGATVVGVTYVNRRAPAPTSTPSTPTVTIALTTG